MRGAARRAVALRAHRVPAPQWGYLLDHTREFKRVLADGGVWSKVEMSERVAVNAGRVGLQVPPPLLWPPACWCGVVGSALARCSREEPRSLPQVQHGSQERPSVDYRKARD